MICRIYFLIKTARLNLYLCSYLAKFLKSQNPYPTMLDPLFIHLPIVMHVQFSEYILQVQNLWIGKKESASECLLFKYLGWTVETILDENTKCLWCRALFTILQKFGPHT